MYTTNKSFGGCFRSSSVPRHEYCVLHSDCSAERHLNNEVRDGAFNTCKNYLSNTDRYELKTHLANVGWRADKQW